MKFLIQVHADQGIYKGTGTVSKSRDAHTDVTDRGDSAQWRHRTAPDNTTKALSVKFFLIIPWKKLYFDKKPQKTARILAAQSKFT